ncbi:MAG TPA: peptidase S41, partial [Ruminococcaceae bacterium]|nr:peptidase S41 [Oscillospiraceae bacterium]
MKRKIPWTAAVSIAAVTAAVTVSLTYGYAMDSFNRKVADVDARQALYTKLSEIDRKVRQDYFGKVDETSLRDGLCTGYVAGLGDPHAQYLSAEKYKAYRDSSRSGGTGAGVTTVQDGDGNMEVIEVAPGSPAEKAGVKKGDTIIAVNGDDVARITYAAALNQLDGPAGTKVTFRLLRAAQGAASAAAAQPVEITVVRGDYRVQTVAASLLSGNVGFLKISRFAEDTPAEFNGALARLMRGGASGLVIDLRNNSSGSMAAAAAVLDTLLPAGNTVLSRDRAGRVTVESASKANEIPLPLSVLVNGGTSGAAEVFAADVRDFRKGVLVGEKTAGNSAKTA